MEKKKSDFGWLIVLTPLIIPVLLIAVIVWSRFNPDSSGGKMLPLKDTATAEAAALAGKKLVPIAWGSSFETGLKTAASTKKLVMIDFYADGWGVCRWMDSNTYLDPAVVKESRKFVNVKLDVAKNFELAQKYNIGELPTILWTDQQGNEVKRVTGQYQPHELLAEMQAVG